MSLEARITKVEDELAVRNVIARYGLAADCANIEAALYCHTTDAVYIVSNPDAGRGAAGEDLELCGHAAIAQMLQSERHRALLTDCAHTVGPLCVNLRGETAEVTGYSRVYHAQNLLRVAVNSWQLKKQNGDWKIVRRESRVTNEAAAKALLRRGLNHV